MQMIWCSVYKIIETIVNLLAYRIMLTRFYKNRLFKNHFHVTLNLWVYLVGAETVHDERIRGNR